MGFKILVDQEHWSDGITNYYYQLDDADRSDVTGDRNPRTSSWIAGIYTRAVINRAFVETPQVLAAFRNADLVSFEVDPFPELEGAEFCRQVMDTTVGIDDGDIVTTCYHVGHFLRFRWITRAPQAASHLVKNRKDN